MHKTTIRPTLKKRCDYRDQLKNPPLFIDSPGGRNASRKFVAEICKHNATIPSRSDFVQKPFRYEISDGNESCVSRLVSATNRERDTTTLEQATSLGDGRRGFDIPLAHHAMWQPQRFDLGERRYQDDQLLRHSKPVPPKTKCVCVICPRLPFATLLCTDVGGPKNTVFSRLFRNDNTKTPCFLGFFVGRSCPPCGGLCPQPIVLLTVSKCFLCDRVDLVEPSPAW